MQNVFIIIRELEYFENLVKLKATQTQVVSWTPLQLDKFASTKFTTSKFSIWWLKLIEH